MGDHVCDIYIDKRIGLYTDYVPDDWAPKAFGPVKSGSLALDHLLMDLLLAWRTTAYTASMPATAIKVVQASTLGYAKFVSPDSSIVAFADAVLAKVSRKVPELVEDRGLRARLMSEIVTVGDEFRAQRAAATPEMPIEPIWEDFLTQDAFAPQCLVFAAPFPTLRSTTHTRPSLWTVRSKRWATPSFGHRRRRFWRPCGLPLPATCPGRAGTTAKSTLAAKSGTR